jgi:hypothetical protein
MASLGSRGGRNVADIHEAAPLLAPCLWRETADPTPPDITLSGADDPFKTFLTRCCQEASSIFTLTGGQVPPIHENEEAEHEPHP